MRDIAEAQRLAATNDVAKNGTRYMLSATDETGELTVQELIDLMRDIYPDINVAGDYEPPETPDHPHGKSTRAINELGLKTHTITETLKDTGDSLMAIAGIEAARR